MVWTIINGNKLRKLLKHLMKTVSCTLIVTSLYNLLKWNESFITNNQKSEFLETKNIVMNNSDDHLQQVSLKAGTLSAMESTNFRFDNSSSLELSYYAPRSEYSLSNNTKWFNETKKANSIETGNVSNVNEKRSCIGKPRSGYCILEAVYKAENTTGFNNSVTLTTQATTGFEYHVEELCRRWQGPVSVAVYAPGDDLKSALENIEYLRRCGHECVQQWVTWHFLYDQMHPPESSLLKLSLNLMKKKVSTHSKNQLFSINCKSKPLSKGETYVRLNNLPYPINVARNVARLNAKTHYVFASDVELYPSENIIPRFLRLVENMKNESSNFTTKRQVFVLPVFEVRSGIQPPTKKEDLRALMKRKDAISFHQYICDVCHRIPNLHRWLETYGSRESLKIFISTKRKYRGSYVGWEPFFIGTNQDPLFDERLTWNGRKNKMQVAHELCFLNYDLHILDDAFLVHASGIKYFNSSFVRMNRPFVATNRRVLRQDIRLLREKYKTESC